MNDSKLPFSNENGKKPAVYLTVDELSALLGLVIETKLKELKLPSTPSPSLPREDEYLNYTQAVAFLKISKPNFKNLRKDGKVRALQVSERRVLFSRTELEAYLQSTQE